MCEPTGSRYRRLGVPGEDKYIGAGIHFCATCDGPFYKGQPVAVVGGGNSAAEESLLLVNYVDRVTLLVRERPNTGFLAGSGLRLDRWGFVVTGHDLVHTGQRPAGYEERNPAFLETSLPGIFVAGNVWAGSTKQVASAAGEGASAALLIREYLKRV